MNWYKKAQSKTFPVWLAEQISKHTENYTKQLPDISWHKDNKQTLKDIEDWIRETNANLDDLDLFTAAHISDDYKKLKQNQNLNEHSPEQINRNWNTYISNTQNINPDANNFAVDLRLKEKAIKPSIKKRINKYIHSLGNYHISIPLQDIFDECKRNGVVALQEDGATWSGLLVGGAECGTDTAKDNQKTYFQLGVQQENGEYVPSKNTLYLTWCKMPSGKYEIVSFIG